MNLDAIDYSLLPDHIRDGMRRYIEFGVKPGSFLTAVLENNFLEAFATADAINTARMQDVANFMHNEAPSPCYGSPARVQKYIEKKQAEREAKKDETPK